MTVTGHSGTAILHRSGYTHVDAMALGCCVLKPAWTTVTTGVTADRRGQMTFILAMML